MEYCIVHAIGSSIQTIGSNEDTYLVIGLVCFLEF